MQDTNARGAWLSTAGLVAGVLLAAAILFSPDSAGGLTPSAKRLAAVTVLMAVLWLTQKIPIAATSLIPLFAFPLLGIDAAGTVAQAYIKSSIFLFLGGFIIALGIEKWGLHRRMALHIVRLLGAGPRRMVLGFMLSTAFLSMWISNTASTLLMLPIGLALLSSLREVLPSGDDEATSVGRASSPFESHGDTPHREESLVEESGGRAGSPSYGTTDADPLRRLSVAVMLGIAYAASIGGLSTLVGTPTNIAFIEIWRQSFPDAPEISAGLWMTSVVPLSAVFLIVTWLVLVFRLPTITGAENLSRKFFTDRLRALGRPSRPEWLMLAVFVTTALLWVFRTPLVVGEAQLAPGWGGWVTGSPWIQEAGRRLDLSEKQIGRFVDDATVAMAMATLLFCIPARRNDDGKLEMLMDWETAERLPWGILLLFGGGFALAAAFQSTGLSQWLGEGFAARASDWPPWLIVGGACLLMTFLTEFTSNVATLSALMPVLAGAAVSLGLDPRLILIPAAISTSCAFMLPIATPPNAIVFGSKQIRMGEMASRGILLNLIGVVLVTIAAFVLLSPQFGITPDVQPDWAQ